MYLVNVNWKIVFIITAASFQCVYPQGQRGNWFQERERNNYCKFSDFGYRPSGRIAVVTRITPPTIINENELLENIGGKAKNSFEIGETVADNAGEVTEKMAEKFKETVGPTLKTIAKTAARLARSLGIFGAVFGVVLDQYGTSVDGVIEKTNTAFARLTEEVNERMDQMKAYVDSKILAFERETITCELAILNKFWLNCASEMTTENSNECQRRASRVIRSSLCKFMLFDTQFQNADKKDLTGEQIRRLEMSLHAFRVYVTLSITVTETLVQSYEEVLQEAEEDLKINKISRETVEAMRKKYLTFLTEEVSDITKYIAYAEWSISQIIKVHTNDGNNYCKQTYKCEKKEKVNSDNMWSPYVGTMYHCSCMFDKTFYESEKCVMKILYNEDSGSTWKAGSSADSKYQLSYLPPSRKDKYRQTTYEQYFFNAIMSERSSQGFGGYITKLQTSMDNYWGGYLKISIKQWKVNLEVITATRDEFLTEHNSDEGLLEKLPTLPTKLKNKSVKEKVKEKKKVKIQVKKEEETKDE